MHKFLLAWLAYTGAIVFVLVVLTNIIVYIESAPYVFPSVDRAPVAEAALIPGAPVYANGVLTPIFTDRVEKARELYLAGKVTKILVSGDNGSTDHNEVNPVRNYLIAEGIPAEDIFLDHAGFDTYSSMYRAKAVFGVTSMIVVSQAFHLPRAVFIARALGIDAYGVDADTSHVLAENYVREVFADEKAMLDLIFQVQPKYLGAAIPITGDGSKYP